MTGVAAAAVPGPLVLAVELRVQTAVGMVFDWRPNGDDVKVSDRHRTIQGRTNMTRRGLGWALLPAVGLPVPDARRCAAASREGLPSFINDDAGTAVPGSVP